jgi:hypothetical protein
MRFSCLDRLEDGAALLLQVGLEELQRLHGLLVGVVALVLGDAEPRAPGVEHAARREVGLAEGERRVEVLDAALREEVDLLGERGLHHLGTAGHDRAARLVHQRARGNSARA